MTGEPARGAFVHDLRHRYSLELRPSDALDAHLRMVATQLEEAGLIPPGASTAPRFHPHVTLLRAAAPPEHAAELVAAALHADGSILALDHADTFGDGRIVHVAPTDRAPLDHVRSIAIGAIDPPELDPLARERPWTPHVTFAYAVPEPSRGAAFAHVVDALPIHGRWGSVQVWDLDVRPTLLVRRVPVAPAG